MSTINADNCTIMYYDVSDVKDGYLTKIGTPAVGYHFNYDFGDPSANSVEQ